MTDVEFLDDLATRVLAKYATGDISAIELTLEESQRLQVLQGYYPSTAIYLYTRDALEWNIRNARRQMVHRITSTLLGATE